MESENDTMTLRLTVVTYIEVDSTISDIGFHLFHLELHMWLDSTHRLWPDLELYVGFSLVQLANIMILHRPKTYDDYPLSKNTKGRIKDFAKEIRKTLSLSQPSLPFHHLIYTTAYYHLRPSPIPSLLCPPLPSQGL